jgi:hypothetical protein
MKRTFLLTLLVLALVVSPVLAQTSTPFEAAVHLAITDSSQFDDTDVGVGGRLAWKATPRLGLEGEVTFYPGEFPGDRPAFSSHRVEGLFGATFGPRFGRWRPFARGRTGFVAFGGASQPIACIAIFPPPLSCQLAAGETLFALDFGGGLEIDATARTFFRVDLGDRMVRYPGPVFDEDLNVREDGFYDHDFRVAFGGGFRF